MDLPAQRRRRRYLGFAQIRRPVSLRCQILNTNDIMIDQGHAADSHRCQLRRHLPPHRPHADHNGVAGGKFFRRHDLTLADITVGQRGKHRAQLNTSLLKYSSIARSSSVSASA